MELIFNLDGNKQTITRVDTNDPVEGSVNYLTAKLVATNMSGMVLTALFSKGGKTYPMVLIQTETDGVITATCEVPAEVIQYSQFEMSAVGNNTTTEERITFPAWKVAVKQSGYSEGQSISDSTPTIYEQLLKKITDLELGVSESQIATAVQAYITAHPIATLTEDDVNGFIQTFFTAHKAELKGDKGDQGDIGPQGLKGDTGNGVLSITKTATDGLVDTYTITYTDTTTATFNVTNGASGEETSYTTISENATVAQYNNTKFAYDDKFTIIPTSTVYIGARNILTFLSAGSSRTALTVGGTIVVNGLSITLNVDGSLLLNGTATSAFYIYTDLLLAVRKMLTNKTVKITFTKSGTTSLIFTTGFGLDGNTYGYNLSATGTKTGVVTGDYLSTESRLTISSGITFSNLIVSAMVEISGVDYLGSYTKGSLNSYSAETEITNVSTLYDALNVISSDGFTIKYNIEGGETDYIDTQITALKQMNPLYGKTVACVGDSLCYGQSFSGGYCTVLGEMEPNTIFLNRAIGGSQISSNGTHWVQDQVTSLTSIPDYIIGEGYVNDYLTSCALGSISSGYTATLDTTTFYGAMESLCKTMINTWSSSRCGFIITHTHYYSSAENENSLYITAIKECCSKWGVPYLDLSNIISPIIDINGTNFYSDGLHYNEAGYRRIANFIDAWLKSI